MFKQLGRLGSKPQKWKVTIRPKKLSCASDQLQGSSVSLGLEKARQATWTADFDVCGREMELDCAPMELTITLYEIGSSKMDGMAILQKKLGYLILRSLRAKDSSSPGAGGGDLGNLRGNLRYDILGSVDLPLHEICPRTLDRTEKRKLTLQPKKGVMKGSVDVEVEIFSELLGDVSETDSDFSMMSEAIPSSSSGRQSGAISMSTNSQVASQLVDQVRVLQMNLERATVDNENLKAHYEERLAAQQQQERPTVFDHSSPRSVSSVNTDGTVSTKLEVLKIENKQLTDRLSDAKDELRSTQSALVAKENGQWRREHQLILERLQQQRLMRTQEEEQIDAGGGGEEEEEDFSMNHHLRPLRSNGKEKKSQSDSGDGDGDGDLTYFMKPGRDVSEEKDEQGSPSRERLEQKDDELAAMAVLLEKAEHDNQSLREQLDMLTAVASGGAKRLGRRVSSPRPLNADMSVQSDMVYNLDQNCLVDLTTLEELNAATSAILDLQGKIARTSQFHDEEREKVRVLKEVLCKWSSRLSSGDKDLLRSAGIILDLEKQQSSPIGKVRGSTLTSLFNNLGGGGGGSSTSSTT